MNRSGRVGSLFMDWATGSPPPGLRWYFPTAWARAALPANAMCATANSVHPRAGRRRSRRAGVAAEQPWAAKDRVALLGWSEGTRRRGHALGGTAARRHGRRGGGIPFGGRPLSGLSDARQRGLERARADPDLDRTRRRLGRRLPPASRWSPAPAGQRARDADRLSGRASRLRPARYPLRELSGLASTADGSGKAHFGTNPAARADAHRRVLQWLAR